MLTTMRRSSEQCSTTTSGSGEGDQNGGAVAHREWRQPPDPADHAGGCRPEGSSTPNLRSQDSS